MPDPNGHHPPESECHHAAQDICKGNKDAIDFCGLWYRYVHAIDDIIDTKEDGRPTMPNEEIIATFITAALLYNCPFYLAHQRHLFPIVVMVTNQYADSVAWERDPINRRRIMADVMRICGDEMFFMVAMICGGWDHVRKVSPLIREEDWRRQHNADDTPN